MSKTNWSRDQTLAALGVYCRTPFGKLHARNPEIVRVASALGRTPSALAMKCCNIASHDPAQQARGVNGLTRSSNLDRQVWMEFESDPESTAFEAESVLAALSERDLEMTESIEWEDVSGLDRERMIKVRVNQSFFRSMILTGYRSSCAVCELPRQNDRKQPKWGAERLSDEVVAQLKTDFERDSYVAVRVPLTVWPKGGEGRESDFVVHLERDETLDRADDHYVRAGITISKVDALRDRGFRGPSMSVTSTRAA